MLRVTRRRRLLDSDLSCHVGRMQCDDMGEALKIRRVESQDAFYPVRLHDGGEPSIVDFCAFDFVGHYQTPPNAKRLNGIRQQGKEQFDS